MSVLIFMTGNREMAIHGPHAVETAYTREKRRDPSTTETQTRGIGPFKKEIEVEVRGSVSSYFVAQKTGLFITIPGTGYYGSGEIYTAPDITFSQYADALTKPVDGIVDLRPIQRQAAAKPPAAQAG